MKREPHPFARFINILGRGKTLTRSLTIEEAEEAMTMILAGETLPEQLGAFLMLLRVKEESPAEIAGFVRGARASIPTSAHSPQVDLDWSSYAGKRRQLPWFVLSALLLARSGWRLFMHGAEAHIEGRIYTGAAGAGPARVGEPRRGGGSSRTAQFRLSAHRRPQREDRGYARAAADPGLTFARTHLRPHAQPLLRAVYVAGRLPSQLHDDPSRRGGVVGPASPRGVPRRGRRDRASSQQAERGAWRDRRGTHRRALAADHP